MADRPKEDIERGHALEVIRGRKMIAYSPELALEIVERIAEGELLSDLCKLKQFPTCATFLKWVARTPELAHAFSAAKEISAYLMEEEALITARAVLKEPGTPQRVAAARALIDQLRWSAGRRDPKNYGERQDARVVVPIQINTTLDMGGGGQVEGQDLYTIDVQPTPEPEIPSPLVKKGRRGGNNLPPGPRKRVLTPRVGQNVEEDEPS